MAAKRGSGTGRETGFLAEIFSSRQGEGPRVGERQLFIRLAGCDRRCSWCDTPEARRRGRHFTLWDRGARRLANPVAAADLAALVRPLLAAAPAPRALALTGGEPLLQGGFLAAFLDCLRPRPPAYLETNGASPSALGRLAPRLAGISLDAKLPWNRARAGRFAAALRAAGRCPLWVKTVLTPRVTPAAVGGLARALSRRKRPPLLVIQPVTLPDGRLGVTPAALDRAEREAGRFLEEVRVLPQVHRLAGWK